MQSDRKDLELLGEGDTNCARRAGEVAGSAGNRQHSLLGLLRLEANDPLDSEAATLPHGGDDAVRQRLLRVLLRNSGQGAHARVVADDGVAAIDLVRGGELIVDDQLVALG